MSREKTPIEVALWQGVLAVIDALPIEGTTQRAPGDFTEDGPKSTVRSVFKVKQPDGSWKSYAITTTAEESQDNSDSYWGPGGTRDNDDPTKRVVVNANHYLIDEETGRPEFRGFAGRRFAIAFFDGRAITTTNLMHQGVIPPKWRERFPDNARFVKPESGLTFPGGAL
jgi:hypothetical protein